MVKSKSEIRKTEYGFNLAYNENGPVLGYSDIPLIEQEGLLFKDLNGSGLLEPYKDWRLSAEERAADLASRMSIEEIAGLMLYSSHQTVLKNTSKYEALFGANTYKGKTLSESGVEIWELTDQQKKFMKDNHLRHFLLSSVENASSSARWSNNIQKFAENLSWGIPVNICSDPRHGIKNDAEYNLGAGGEISKWPEQLGLAATFDEETVKKFGEIASAEYRALGITTALSPQIDLATDPRWMRFKGTFGENTNLVTILGREYCDAMQSSSGDKEIEDGWGYKSVNTMVKHWPGGGSGEGGRDAHFTFGKYAVYPGDKFNEHIKPFTEGALKLHGKTKKASAVMPYYTISYGVDPEENVGNSYSKYIITDLLRTKFNYDDVICTDWLITADHGPKVETFSGKPWGVEHLSVSERHYKALLAGVDQFGGNNELEPVLDAYKLGVEEHGNEFMRKRFETSAVRILKNIFRTGLFENPYLDIEETVQLVGNPKFMKEGYEAQLNSAVLLKNNKNVLPIEKGKKVYIPKKFIASSRDWFGNPIPEKYEYPVNVNMVKKYFTITDNPEEADFSLVFVSTPKSNGYINGEYVPISLQYRPYYAEQARDISMAGGDPLEHGENRTYKGKKNTVMNENDLDLIIETKKKMKSKPVIVCLLMDKPGVLREFEPQIEGILAHFGIQDQALLDIVAGESEPSGLLPFQIPASMETVENQKEDVPMDMDCHVDKDNNTYDFGFGLNWRGKINDYRVTKYLKMEEY